ncbi:hypothetical protein [Rahnella perminowiae]|nr:hypothetical protein [Rahnella perminowiae]
MTLFLLQKTITGAEKRILQQTDFETRITLPPSPGDGVKQHGLA